jgi:hypothetical protein
MGLVVGLGGSSRVEEVVGLFDILGDVANKVIENAGYTSTEETSELVLAEGGDAEAMGELTSRYMKRHPMKAAMWARRCLKVKLKPPPRTAEWLEEIGMTKQEWKDYFNDSILDKYKNAQTNSYGYLGILYLEGGLGGVDLQRSYNCFYRAKEDSERVNVWHTFLENFVAKYGEFKYTKKY